MATLNLTLTEVTSVFYNSPSQGYTNLAPNIVQFGSAATWAKPFTLTCPALPTGVASCTISRTSTNMTGAATGVILTAGNAQATVPIYYGDVLTISAMPAVDYGEPTVSLSQTTVSGNVTATITAGATWHTVLDTSSSISVSANITSSSSSQIISVSGLNNSLPTRFTGNITASGGFTSQDAGGLYVITATQNYTYNQSWNATQTTGVNNSGQIEASVKMTTNAPFYITGVCTLTVTLSTGQIELTGALSDFEGSDGGTYALAQPFLNATLNLTKVEQFY